MVLGYWLIYESNEIYESNDTKISRVACFGTGCTTRKPSKYVLANLQTAITFALVVRIGHIVYDFVVEN